MNVVTPGPVATEALRELFSGQPEGSQAELEAGIPLGCVAHPDDVAGAALFLASDDGAYNNGVELFVEGGMRQI